MRKPEDVEVSQEDVTNLPKSSTDSPLKGAMKPSAAPATKAAGAETNDATATKAVSDDQKAVAKETPDEVAEKQESSAPKEALQAAKDPSTKEIPATQEEEAVPAKAGAPSTSSP